MKSTTTKIGHNNLISSCLLPFQSTLNTSLESAISKTLQHLFSLAENASSNQQETKLFEQYNLLKKTSGKLLDSLNAVAMSMPDEITEQISLGEDAFKLSLVEDEELEISLGFTQLESVLDVKYSKYLFPLEKRLKVLFASRNISKANMPFGVTSVCWIFSQTLDLSASDIATKVHLIESLKKELSKDLLEIYKLIDKKFTEAGILPNLKAEPKRIAKNKKANTAQTPQEDANNPFQGFDKAAQYRGSPQDQGMQGGNYGNQPQFGDNANLDNSGQFVDDIHTRSAELVNSIFDLMNKSRLPGVQSPMASNIDNNVLDNTLENLSKITSVAAGSTEIDKLKEMILDDVRNETGIYYPSLSTEQQNSLDVMGMFYEQVHDDNSIDSNIISSLNAINIPLIRTAIKDDGFFNTTNHPAREYLEKIIYASQKWHGTSVVKKIHKFSSNIASEYNGSPESFNDANEELESYLRLTERRAKKAEEKWVNAAKGKEKLQISRSKVEEVVENVSQNAVPEFVKNVIKYVIQDALTLSLLRHGEDSDEWHKNINTSTTIAKMANPKTVKQLTPKQKIESLHHLDQTMDELGFSENDRTKTLSNIKDCANAAMTDDLTDDIKLQEVATINKDKKNIKKAGSVKIEELRPLTAKERTELTKIKLMPYGTLFDFITNQQRDKIRRKLSWFSPVSNKALFVSLLGNRPYERSLNAIAIDIARSNIIVVKIEKKKYFDKVLGDILSKLKGIIGQSAKAH
jgi:hypothetical protein